MNLRDCIVKDPSQVELLLVFSEDIFEMAKVERDRLNQAILQIDPTFVLSEEIDEVLDNPTCQFLWSSLGTGIILPGGDEETFDITKLRYGKVIVVAEGNHILDDLIRFFYTYLTPILTAGHIVVPEEPLKPGTTQQEFVENILNSETRRLRVVKYPNLLLDDL